jgi:hypothetical protein
MASFHTKTFTKHDDYMTPKSAWEAINHIIPTDKVIWEPFSGNGNSRKFLTELGYDVISMDEDFFENNRGEVIITNPPFSKKEEVFARLKEIGKPFIVICPSSMINTQYMRKLFSDDENPIQVIIPRRRIHFMKLVDGEVPEGWKSTCNFDCFYYCWKMNLPRDITWLETLDSLDLGVADVDDARPRILNPKTGRMVLDNASNRKRIALL